MIPEKYIHYVSAGVHPIYKFIHAHVLMRYEKDMYIHDYSTCSCTGMVSAKDCIVIHLHVQVHASLFPCSPPSVELLGEARINNITKAIADTCITLYRTSSYCALLE